MIPCQPSVSFRLTRHQRRGSPLISVLCCDFNGQPDPIRSRRRQQESNASPLYSQSNSTHYRVRPLESVLRLPAHNDGTIALLHNLHLRDGPRRRQCSRAILIPIFLGVKRRSQTKLASIIVSISFLTRSGHTDGHSADA